MMPLDQPPAGENCDSLASPPGKGGVDGLREPCALGARWQRNRRAVRKLLCCRTHEGADHYRVSTPHDVRLLDRSQRSVEVHRRGWRKAEVAAPSAGGHCITTGCRKHGLPRDGAAVDWAFIWSFGMRRMSRKSHSLAPMPAQCPLRALRGSERGRHSKGVPAPKRPARCRADSRLTAEITGPEGASGPGT